MHARLTVRRLVHGPHKHRAPFFQQPHRFRHMLAQDARKLIIVRPVGMTFGEQAHVLEVRLGRINDAQAFLILRLRGADGAYGARGGAAQLFALLQQHHACATAARTSCTYSCGYPCAAAAHHDHIGLQFTHQSIFALENSIILVHLAISLLMNCAR